MNFLPQKYSSLRLVPAYRRFINERFDRCLDLYLCPRKPKIKVTYVCYKVCSVDISIRLDCRRCFMYYDVLSLNNLSFWLTDEH